MNEIQPSTVGRSLLRSRLTLSRLDAVAPAAVRHGDPGVQAVGGGTIREQISVTGRARVPSRKHLGVRLFVMPIGDAFGFLQRRADHADCPVGENCVSSADGGHVDDDHGRTEPGGFECRTEAGNASADNHDIRWFPRTLRRVHLACGTRAPAIAAIVIAQLRTRIGRPGVNTAEPCTRRD
jgi:hypothetical protein